MLWPRTYALWPLLILLTIALVICMTISIGFGSVAISWSDVWGIALYKLGVTAQAGDWPKGTEAIVWQLRFPRVLLGILVGAGLAAVGVALQAITRNSMADPYLFGVSSGASVGAVLVMLHIGPIFGGLTLPLFAFLGGMLAVVLVLLLVFRGGNLNSNKLILSGLSIYFLLLATTNLLIFLGDHKAASAVVFWMLGGLGRATWSQLFIPTLVISVGLVVLMMHSMTLNSFLGGDDHARALGVSVAKKRMVLLVISALITSTCVAYAGAIGFVGLMIPHMARFLVGSHHARVIPVSALIGAIFLVLSDILARILIRPEDLPIGIITAGLGGLFFIIMIRNK